MRVLLLAAACALVLVSPGPAHGEVASPAFVAEPASGSQTDPAGGWFVLAAQPGSEVGQAVALRNDSPAPLEIQLGAVDAVTGPFGGASYASASDAPVHAGTWITLERTRVTLAPGASAVVPFRVDVPVDASTGQHLAGIAVEVPDPTQATAVASEGQAGASIDVRTRRVIAVQVELPGPAEPELVVRGVAPVARPGGLDLAIALENAGHGLTEARGVLRVGDDFVHEFEVGTFVPGTSIDYPVTWTDQARGEHAAVVEVRYGERTARWEGSFTVGEQVLAELQERRVGPSAGTSGSSLLLPGGAVVAAVLLAAALLALAHVRRPRGRHGRGERRHAAGRH